MPTVDEVERDFAGAIADAARDVAQVASHVAVSGVRYEGQDGRRLTIASRRLLADQQRRRAALRTIIGRSARELRECDVSLEHLLALVRSAMRVGIGDAMPQPSASTLEHEAVRWCLEAYQATP